MRTLTTLTILACITQPASAGFFTPEP